MHSLLLCLALACFMFNVSAGPVPRNHDNTRRGKAPVLRYIAASIDPLAVHLFKRATVTAAPSITTDSPSTVSSGISKQPGKVPVVWIGGQNTSLTAGLSSASIQPTSPATAQPGTSEAGSKSGRQNGSVLAVGVGGGNTSLLGLLNSTTGTTGTILVDRSSQSTAAATSYSRSFILHSLSSPASSSRKSEDTSILTLSLPAPTDYSPSVSSPSTTQLHATDVSCTSSLQTDSPSALASSGLTQSVLAPITTTVLPIPGSGAAQSADSTGQSSVVPRPAQATTIHISKTLTVTIQITESAAAQSQSVPESASPSSMSLPVPVIPGFTTLPSVPPLAASSSTVEQSAAITTAPASSASSVQPAPEFTSTAAQNDGSGSSAPEGSRARDPSEGEHGSAGTGSPPAPMSLTVIPVSNASSAGTVTVIMTVTAR